MKRPPRKRAASPFGNRALYDFVDAFDVLAVDHRAHITRRICCRSYLHRTQSLGKALLELLCDPFMHKHALACHEKLTRELRQSHFEYRQREIEIGIVKYD